MLENYLKSTSSHFKTALEKSLRIDSCEYTTILFLEYKEKKCNFLLLLFKLQILTRLLMITEDI